MEGCVPMLFAHVEAAQLTDGIIVGQQLPETGDFAALRHSHSEARRVKTEWVHAAGKQCSRP